MVSAAQLLNQFRQSDSNPVDFWRPGFRDHGNSQMPLQGFDVFNRDGCVMCKFHAFMVADEFNNLMTCQQTGNLFQLNLLSFVIVFSHDEHMMTWSRNS